MKTLNKTLIAAAMLAGAGSANASIAYDQSGSNEAYLAAYDITTGKTFNFDTGVTYDNLVANENNSAFSLNFDFSGDSNWTNFITGASLSSIKYVVAVGNTNVGAAITLDSPLTPNAEVNQGIFFGADVATAISAHAIDINSKVIVNNAQNLSTLALDSESPGAGQFGEATTVWNSWIQDPTASYGQSIGFQLGVLDQTDGHNIASTFAGKWQLAGNGLTFSAPAVAAVPLPAAVWLFGAGLMTMLRANRRPSMALAA
ncbi:hypothetical protein [Methylomicrobium lacus]|uniref:hypothetical protein n=1 Tax=Methylomicrobium lacus TaxID=136992 RepID=UPI0035A831CC